MVHSLQNLYYCVILVFNLRDFCPPLAHPIVPVTLAGLCSLKKLFSLRIYPSITSMYAFCYLKRLNAF